MRKYRYTNVLEHIDLIANDDEKILMNVRKYIKEVKKNALEVQKL